MGDGMLTKRWITHLAKLITYGSLMTYLVMMDGLMSVGHAQDAFSCQRRYMLEPAQHEKLILDGHQKVDVEAKDWINVRTWSVHDSLLLCDHVLINLTTNEDAHITFE